MGWYDGQVWGSRLLSLLVGREGESSRFIVIDYCEVRVVDKVVNGDTSMIGGGGVPCGLIGIKISCDDFIMVVAELIEKGYSVGVIYYCGGGSVGNVAVCYVKWGVGVQFSDDGFYIVLVGSSDFGELN